jgi:NDP-sugar pyrophosphorylase family protein
MGVETQVVIQAGGRGQRLMPLTRDLPKPLIRVGGLPLIERLVRQLIADGLLNITIILGWHGHHIRSHFRSLKDLPEDLSLDFRDEEIPAGNAAALLDYKRANSYVLFVFADIVTSLSFRALLEVHKNDSVDITLASHVESHQLRLGELIIAGTSVLDYVEKPRKDFVICSGVAVFSPGSLEFELDLPSVGLADVIAAALGHGRRVGHWPHQGWWIDVNDASALERANTEIGAHSVR